MYCVKHSRQVFEAYLRMALAGFQLESFPMYEVVNDNQRQLERLTILPESDLLN